MSDATLQRHRIIWAFGFGYFAFYAPYSALVKLITSGSFGPRLSGFEILPAAIAGTLVSVPIVFSVLGWWRFVGIPRDSRVLVSGIATAAIITTTTLAYGFAGVSIVFTLLLLRGGVLILAPIVDVTAGRRVRWFSWVALAFSLGAVALAFAGIDHTLSIAAGINIAIYLLGYVLRLPAMTALAKKENVDVTRRYFVQELLVASIALAFVPPAFAVAGFVKIWTSPLLLPSLTTGVLYAGLYVFGTLIYLDRRENTFCVPLNRASSLLAGVAASLVLTAIWGFPSMPASHLAGVFLVVLALLALSPVHHIGELLIEAVHMTRSVRSVCLFVCSANTCRSAMAEAIANAEMRVPWRAVSAGTSANPGEPMTKEAHEALARLTIQAPSHMSRMLTPALIDEAEVIYCMTAKHRDAVVRFVPAAAAKTFTLDPAGDIDDPIGKPLETYVDCARSIQLHVRSRFRELATR